MLPITRCSSNSVSFETLKCFDSGFVNKNLITD